MLTWFVDGVPTDDTVILERGYYHQTSSLDSVLTSTLFAPGSIANNGSRIQCGVVGQDMVLELSDEAVFTVQGLTYILIVANNNWHFGIGFWHGFVCRHYYQYYECSIKTFLVSQ